MGIAEADARGGAKSPSAARADSENSEGALELRILRGRVERPDLHHPDLRVLDHAVDRVGALALELEMAVRAAHHGERSGDGEGVVDAHGHRDGLVVEIGAAGAEAG